MSVDIRVYLINNFNLDDKDTLYYLVGYFNLKTGDNNFDTLNDIENNYDFAFGEDPYKECRSFSSYVFSFDNFEKNVANSNVKERILESIQEYNKEWFSYIVLQPF